MKNSSKVYLTDENNLKKAIDAFKKDIKQGERDCCLLLTKEQAADSEFRRAVSGAAQDVVTFD